jgi:hypothetical protein
MRSIAGVDPKAREYRRLVIMDFNDIFQAVVDESGYEAADRRYPDDVFVFAGYIGKIVDWANFTRSWEPIIEAHPELEDSKFVKKLMRWSGSKSDSRALDLMNAVVMNVGLGSIRWRLPYRELRAAAHRAPGEEEMYFFAWSGVLTQCLAVILPIPNARLEFIYDQNLAEEAKVQAAYVNYRRALQREVPILAERLALRARPMSDAEFWPLRAADGLAWNTHRHWIRQRQKPFSNPLWRLMDAGPKAFDETWNAQDVRDVLSEAEGHRELINRRVKRIVEEAARNYGFSRPDGR